MENFGDKLTAYIDQRGWSRDYVSKNTSVPRNTLWAWEKGNRTPPKYVQAWFFFRMNHLGLPKKE